LAIVQQPPSSLPPPAVAEVWLGRPSRCSGRRKTEYLDWLSDAEKQRLERFRFDEDRNSFLIAHGLLRTALSRRLPDFAPVDWVFSANAHGRPEILNGGEAAGIRFNISHSRTLVACVITQGVSCGIDVEHVDRRIGDMHELAKRALSEPERKELCSTVPERQAECFFRYWTLKEAYTKAVGLGMSLPFDKIIFALGDACRLVRDDTLMNEPDRFSFEQWMTTDRHVVTVALEAKAGARRIVCRDADNEAEGEVMV
jgi:4'-phosphopantetheinyl transferase